MHQEVDVFVSLSAGVFADPPAKSGEYEVATIWLTDAGGLNLPYKPSDFEFKSKNGRIYPPVAASSAPREVVLPLGEAELTAGKSVVGRLIFDVPRGGGSITYSNETTGRNASWTTNT